MKIDGHKSLATFCVGIVFFGVCFVSSIRESYSSHYKLPHIMVRMCSQRVNMCKASKDI